MPARVDQSAPASGGRGPYVVARSQRRPGIGTRLLSMAGAVWVARELERTVVVDWLGSCYLQDLSLNYFTEFFEPVPETLGVPILYAPSAEAGDYRQAPETERLRLHASECRQLLAERRPAPKYLVTGGIYTLKDLDPAGNEKEHRRFLKAFYDRIAPREEVGGPLEAWYDDHLRGHFVVGVNVSTGNGPFKDRDWSRHKIDPREFEDEERFLSRIQNACEAATSGLPRKAREASKVFVATDSTPMSGLLSRLPGAVTRRSVFPPTGVGRYFSDYGQVGYTDRAAQIDTIVDMMLLARCHALIRNDSMFSYYALVSSDFFGGRVFDFEGKQYDLQTLKRRIRGKAESWEAAEARRQARARLQRGAVS
jgi:hypothetical protein